MQELIDIASAAGYTPEEFDVLFDDADQDHDTTISFEVRTRLMKMRFSGCLLVESSSCKGVCMCDLLPYAQNGGCTTSDQLQPHINALHGLFCRSLFP